MWGKPGDLQLLGRLAVTLGMGSGASRTPFSVFLSKMSSNQSGKQQNDSSFLTVRPPPQFLAPSEGWKKKRQRPEWERERAGMSLRVGCAGSDDAPLLCYHLQKGFSEWETCLFDTKLPHQY